MKTAALTILLMATPIGLFALNGSIAQSREEFEVQSADGVRYIIHHDKKPSREEIRELVNAYRSMRSHEANFMFYKDSYIREAEPRDWRPLKNSQGKEWDWDS